MYIPVVASKLIECIGVSFVPFSLFCLIVWVVSISLLQLPFIMGLHAAYRHRLTELGADVRTHTSALSLSLSLSGVPAFNLYLWSYYNV